MKSKQYEELCRYFIAKKACVAPEQVKSVTIPNPKRADLPAYRHQIDLYWESGDEIALYLNIANAKWRGSDKVDQPDVMLLQQVRQKVSAHKAFMITNVGFTAGAVAAAKDEGIALHVVAPTFSVSELPTGDRAAIQARLQAIASDSNQPIFSHRVEHRGLGFPGDRSQPSSPKVQAARYETRVVAPSPSRTSPAATNRAIRGGESRGGQGRTSGDSRGGGGIVKK